MNSGKCNYVLTPVPPGKALEEEMKVRNLSANALALRLRVPANRISDIIRNKRSISAETALRLGQAFGNSGKYWFNLQKNYDLALATTKLKKIIRKEVIPLDNF